MRDWLLRYEVIWLVALLSMYQERSFTIFGLAKYTWDLIWVIALMSCKIVVLTNVWTNEAKIKCMITLDCYVTWFATYLTNWLTLSIIDLEILAFVLVVFSLEITYVLVVVVVLRLFYCIIYKCCHINGNILFKD